MPWVVCQGRRELAAETSTHNFTHCLAQSQISFFLCPNLNSVKKNWILGILTRVVVNFVASLLPPGNPFWCWKGACSIHSLRCLPQSHPFVPALVCFWDQNDYYFSLSLLTKGFVFKPVRRCTLNFQSQENNSWYTVCLILQERDSPPVLPAGMKEAGGVHVWLPGSYRCAINQH